MKASCKENTSSRHRARAPQASAFTDGIMEALRRHAHVIVIEEAAPYALGLRVKALAWEARARCRLDVFSLQDAFIHTYGSPGELLAAHGLDLASIARKVGVE